MAQKEQRLEIEILGKLDSSVMESVNAVKNALKEMGADSRTSNEAMKRAYSQMFDGVGKGAQKGFQEATAQASKFQDFMSNVKSTMTGVFAADIAQDFFHSAIEGAQKLVSTMKEASNLSANMELQRAQFQLENQLTPEQMGKMNDYFTKRSVEVPITKTAQYEGAKIISTAIQETDADKKMELVRKESEMIQDLAAMSVHVKAGESPVAALNEQYATLSLIISNMQKYGVSLENTIKPLEAAGLNVRPRLLLDKGAITQEQFEHWSSIPAEERDKILGGLAKDIKGRKLYESAVMQTLWEADQPGGKAYGAAGKIAQTTAGVESSSQDVYQYFMSKLGDIENGPLKEFLGTINKGFIDAVPQADKFFDGIQAKLSPIFSKDITAFFDVLGKQDWSTASKAATEAVDSLAKVLEKSEPLVTWFAKSLPSEIEGLLKLATAFETVGSAIEKAFAWILNFDPLNVGVNDTPEQAKARREAKANATVEDLKRRSAGGGQIGDKPGTFPNLPRQAAGGIVTRATALVAGEAGPEAIIPLTMLRDSPLVSATEANAKETRRLAEAMSSLTDNIAKMSFGMASGYGGGGGGASTGAHETDYGPSVPGDQPGGATYDWNSYHGIGAFTQHLQLGDAAMHEAYGRAIGATHLGMFLDPNTGQMKRWADISGSKDPMNIDNYRGAAGAIVRRATRALIGERGPEAVVPLNRAPGASALGGGITLNYSPTIHGAGDIGTILREHAEELLGKLEEALSRRFAAEALV